jgi:hypothetical protein
MRTAAAVILLAAAGCEESRAPGMTGPAGLAASDSATSRPAQAAADRVDTKDASLAGHADSNPATTEPADPSSQATSPAVSETRAAAPAEPERTRDISFDDLKFDIQKGDPFRRSLLTEKIESLAGKPIRIRGYILPSFQQSGLTQFVLVRDNQSCCFGPGAALYDCVIVEMKPGKSTDYSLYPVAVDGTFSIHEMVDPDGKTVAVYHLDGESVR